MTTPTINRLVPMVFARDVDASIAFYKVLGFEVADRLIRDGRAVWAWLSAGHADMMLSRASDWIDPAAQAILLYLYSENVHSLRADLLKGGVADAGAFPAKDPPNDGKRVLFDITRPFYMPDGELRVHDPDGHCLLVGQSSRYPSREP